MKTKIAIIRGPNLNSWEMQNFAPLADAYDLVGFTSSGNSYDISLIPFEIRKLFSVGEFLSARFLRNPMNNLVGDYHDLVGLESALSEFDIVNTAETSYYCSYQAAKSKRENGFKLVLTVWENIPFLINHSAAVRNKKEIARQTDLFLAISERAKEVLILEGMPEEKVKVQMPGIDVDHFHPMPKDIELLQRFGCDAEDFVVLYVANLYREKGIFDLIFAFRRLMDRLGEKSKIKLLIAGRGRERDNILRLIRQLRLESCARLIGSYPYSEMPKIHNLGDAFVLPSIPIPTWQEQFGYVLVESMACGKPVISTLSGSIPEVVGDAGILVQPNDCLSILTALERLVSDVTYRNELSVHARACAENNYDSKKVAVQFEQHYNSL